MAEGIHYSWSWRLDERHPDGVGPDTPRTGPGSFDRDHAGMSLALPRLLCLWGRSPQQRRDAATTERLQGPGARRSRHRDRRRAAAGPRLDRGRRAVGPLSRAERDPAGPGEPGHLRAAGDECGPRDPERMARAAEVDDRRLDRRPAT